jgi:P pilus assembly chaperone PapD
MIYALIRIKNKRLGWWLFLLLSGLCQASGVVPETSVVIVEESSGEGAINLVNTDAWPVLMLTRLQDVAGDQEKLLMVTPAATRVEPGKTQRIRFMLTSETPLKTERLKRVIFEGIPPQTRGKNEVRMTVRQNLPLIIRPAGLQKDPAPWKHLRWQASDAGLVVSNPSPYVVRLSQSVLALPCQQIWALPQAYVLPGQKLTLTPGSVRDHCSMRAVRLSPATTWGFSVDNYDAPLS